MRPEIAIRLWSHFSMEGTIHYLKFDLFKNAAASKSAEGWWRADVALIVSPALRFLSSFSVIISTTSTTFAILLSASFFSVSLKDWFCSSVGPLVANSGFLHLSPYSVCFAHILPPSWLVFREGIADVTSSSYRRFTSSVLQFNVCVLVALWFCTLPTTYDILRSRLPVVNSLTKF